MNKLTSAAILVGGAIMASQSAFGGFVPNDLYLGFQNQLGGAASDYIINLGTASSVGVGGSITVDLSGNFSLTSFNTVLGSSSSVFGGVIGGLSSSTGTADEYVTQLRTSNFGDIGTLQPNSAGSTLSTTASRSGIDNGINTMTAIALPAAGTQGSLDGTKSWQGFVEPTSTSQTFLGASGINPDSAIGKTSVVYEDLYYVSNGHSFGNPQPYVYEGYLTLDLTGGGSSVTFTPTAVPEPATMSLMGGGGLLLLALRRRSMGKKA